MRDYVVLKYGSCPWEPIIDYGRMTLYRFQQYFGMDDKQAGMLQVGHNLI